jgi:hypothetical protein
MRIRIEIILHTSTHPRSDVKKWLQFLRIRGISRPQVDLEMVVLTDSKDKDKDDLRFFQNLK